MSYLACKENELCLCFL